MTTPTLHDRLTDLAREAPSGSADPGLWDAGVRRHRRRRAAALAAGAAVVALVGGVGVSLGLGADTDRSVPPADVPFGDLHLPRTVYPPSEWADGTAETGPPGPLAAVAVATRSEPEGWTGVRRGAAVFGVSAVDGTAVFLDLPGAPADFLGPGTLTLSPDGTKVGYDQYRDRQLVGWSVYDTVTGEVTRLRDPEQDVLRGRDAFEIAFSGDSRYLQTNYSPAGSDGSRQDALVVWDVATGEPIEAEGTGNYWLPNLGSAPSGIVWSRKDETFTFDPATGETTTARTPYDVIEWSEAPDGGASAAVAFGEATRDPWRLYAGARLLDPGLSPDDLLGWRDAHVVVVGSLPDHRISYLDVRTGEQVASDRMRVRSDGDDPLMWPVYAADLWANDLVDGVRPPATGDPRVGPWEVAGWVAAAAGLAALGTWLVRRRRVRP